MTFNVVFSFQFSKNNVFEKFTTISFRRKKKQSAEGKKNIFVVNKFLFFLEAELLQKKISDFDFFVLSQKIDIHFFYFFSYFLSNFSTFSKLNLFHKKNLNKKVRIISENGGIS